MARIIHTADWHLGKTLGDRSRDAEHALFLDFLLETIELQKIDTLLVCGDVFDSANPPQSALARYYDFLTKLRRTSSCRVIIIAGNHDSPALLEAPRELLQSLDIHVVARTPTLLAIPSDAHPLGHVAAIPFLRDADLRSGVSGQDAAAMQQEMNDSMAKIYQNIAPPSALPWIATGHLTVTGASSSDSEREIHIGGLGAFPASRFPAAAYIALGHLHRPQACGSYENIRYSGSPIALSFSECRDRKELRLLELSDDGALRHEPIAIPDFRRLIRYEAATANASEWKQGITAALAERPSTLPAWVEVRLSRMVADALLQACLECLAAEGAFDILRVIPLEKSSATAGAAFDLLRVGEDNPLDDPLRIFDQRLALEETISAEKKETLRHLFQQLLETRQEG